MTEADCRSKLPGAGTTIFTVMSEMAQEHDAIDLSQGFPDFECPQVLRELVSRNMQQGNNQYAPLAGVPELQEQIAGLVLDRYGCKVDPAVQVTVTPGATEAIFCAVTATVFPGDEVIVFDPAYDTYEPCIRLNGGRARRIPLRGPGFSVDWDRVRESINDRTRLIMLNTPHNPTGSVWEADDMSELRRVLEGTGISLVSDEVYEHMTFDSRPHLSLLRYPDLARRAYCISSFGKTYHVTGWRIGYCVAPPAMMREFLRIHQFINFSTNTPMQYAIAGFLRDHPGHHQELAKFYQNKRNLFIELMKQSRFDLKPCAGTYFQLAEYGAISNEPDTEFAAWLTCEHKVAAIPMSVFCAQPPDRQYVRFCFAKHDDTLRAATERLAAI